MCMLPVHDLFYFFSTVSQDKYPKSEMHGLVWVCGWLRAFSFVFDLKAANDFCYFAFFFFLLCTIAQHSHFILRIVLSQSL